MRSDRTWVSGQDPFGSDLTCSLLAPTPAPRNRARTLACCRVRLWMTRFRRDVTGVPLNSGGVAWHRTPGWNSTLPVAAAICHLPLILLLETQTKRGTVFISFDGASGYKALAVFRVDSGVSIVMTLARHDYHVSSIKKKKKNKSQHWNSHSRNWSDRFDVC